MNHDRTPPSQPTITPDGQWLWDGAQWVPNRTSPTEPDPTQGFGTPDGSAVDSGADASSTKKPVGLSSKVGAYAFAVALGLAIVGAASFDGSEANGNAEGSQSAVSDAEDSTSADSSIGSAPSW